VPSRELIFALGSSCGRKISKWLFKGNYDGNGQNFDNKKGSDFVPNLNLLTCYIITKINRKANEMN